MPGGRLCAGPNHDKLALVVMTKERAVGMAEASVLPQRTELQCARWQD